MRFFPSSRKKTFTWSAAALGAALLLYAALLWFAYGHNVSSNAPLNAGWYAAAERLDPIFAIEGTDPHTLAAAIASLLKNRDDISSGYAARQAAEIQHSLYPAAFLTLLPQLEAARQTLLAQPTQAHAVRYHALLIRTIAAYESGAKTLADMLRTKASMTYQIGFLNGGILTSDMATKMDAVANAAHQQQEKEDARFACAQQYDPFSCDSLATLKAARAKMIAAAAATTYPNVSAQAVAAVDALVMRVARMSDPHAQFSPLIVVPSSCYPYPATYLRSWLFTAPDGHEARQSYVVNDLYFWDIKALATSSPEGALYQDALARGAAIEYQNITNFYMCPDSGELASNVERILGVRELAQNATSTAAKRLLALQILQPSDAARYVESVGSDALYERFLEGSANFSQTIEKLIDEDKFIFASRHVGAAIQFSYLYVARSYASVLFLLGNPTFVPHAPSLFWGKGSAPMPPALHSWLNDLSAHMSTHQMLADTKKSIEVFKALGARK